MDLNLPQPLGCSQAPFLVAFYGNREQTALEIKLLDFLCDVDSMNSNKLIQERLFNLEKSCIGYRRLPIKHSSGYWLYITEIDKEAAHIVFVKMWFRAGERNGL